MKKLLLAATVLAGFAGSAHAGVIDFGGNLNNITAQPSGDLTSSNTIMFTGLTAATAKGGDDTTGIVVSGSGTPVTFAPSSGGIVTAAIEAAGTPQTLTKSWSVGSDNYVETVSYTSTTNSGTGISVNYIGTVTDSASNFVNVPVELNFALSETGTGHVITGAYTDSSVFTPPPGKIPEPFSMSLLGMGLVGLGFVRRRRG
jgi:hypothetical protein